MQFAPPVHKPDVIARFGVDVRLSNREIYCYYSTLERRSEETTNEENAKQADDRKMFVVQCHFRRELPEKLFTAGSRKILRTLHKKASPCHYVCCGLLASVPIRYWVYKCQKKVLSISDITVAAAHLPLEAASAIAGVGKRATHSTGHYHFPACSMGLSRTLQKAGRFLEASYNIKVRTIMCLLSTQFAALPPCGVQRSPFLQLDKTRHLPGLSFHHTRALLY